MDKDIREGVVKETREAKEEDAGGSKTVSDSGVISEAGSAVESSGEVSVSVLYVAELSPMLLASLSLLDTLQVSCCVESAGGVSVLFVAELSPMLLASLSAIATLRRLSYSRFIVRKAS